MLQVFEPFFDVEPLSVSLDRCYLSSQIGDEQPGIRFFSLFFGRGDHCGKIDMLHQTVFPVRDPLIPNRHVFFERFSQCPQIYPLSAFRSDRHVAFDTYHKQDLFLLKKLEQCRSAESPVSCQKEFLLRSNSFDQIDQAGKEAGLNCILGIFDLTMQDDCPEQRNRPSFEENGDHQALDISGKRCPVHGDLDNAVMAECFETPGHPIAAELIRLYPGIGEEPPETLEPMLMFLCSGNLPDDLAHEAALRFDLAEDAQSKIYSLCLSQRWKYLSNKTLYKMGRKRQNIITPCLFLVKNKLEFSRWGYFLCFEAKVG